MDIQTGVYGNYQKVIDENGKEVLRLVSAGGASSPATATAQYFDVPFDKIPAAELAKIPVGGIISAKADNAGFLTAGAAKDIFVQRIDDPNRTFFYVGGANAADTADEGRGLSPDKPFASLLYAITYVNSHYYSGAYGIAFVLGADIEVDFQSFSYCWLPGIYEFKLLSDSTRRKITLTNDFFLGAGILAIYGVDIDCQAHRLVAYSRTDSAKLYLQDTNIIGTALQLRCSGEYASIRMESNVSISGTASEAGLISIETGTVLVRNTPLTGSVTGKKYSVTHGGRLVTPTGNAEADIPGTIAGTCDEFSTIA